MDYESSGETIGICIIPNIDFGYVPVTPASGNEFRLPKAENMLRQYASHYGHPFGYIQEQRNQIFQQIVPVRRLASVQISSSSTTELDLHTETAFHPYPPDHVFLLCLRGDPTALTTYANLDAILKKLGDTTQKVLRQPWYTTRIDESFLLNGQEDKSIEMPILQGEGKDVRIVYDKYFMRGTSTAARRALNELNDAITKSTHKVALNTGDLMIIDNRTTVHGRLPFTPKYDGTDRWLKRVLIRTSITPSNQIEGNDITTKFY